MPDQPPAITGKELIRLFLRDGWQEHHRATHGIVLKRRDPDGRTRVVVIPDKSETLPPTLLGRILSVKQSGVGRDGLVEMIRRYSLR